MDWPSSRIAGVEPWSVLHCPVVASTESFFLASGSGTLLVPEHNVPADTLGMCLCVSWHDWRLCRRDVGRGDFESDRPIASAGSSAFLSIVFFFF